MTEIKGYVLKPGEGVPGFDGSVKAGCSSTGGSLCVIESTTLGGAPRHVHDVDDEAFYVLDGLLTVECGGEVFEAGRGRSCFSRTAFPIRGMFSAASRRPC